MIPDISTIKPGSILLYHTNDLVDYLITRRSFGVAHVEWYEGGGQSLASRNGIGVNRYPFRAEGLVAVLEVYPHVVENIDYVAAFSAWFETVKGDAYASKSLAGFLLGEAINQPNALICSAFVALGFLRIGCALFNKLWASALVDPSDFLKTGTLHTIWEDTAQLYQLSV